MKWKRVFKILGWIFLSLFIVGLGVIFYFTKYGIPEMMSKTEAEQEKIIVEATGLQPQFHSYQVEDRTMRYIELGDTSKPLVLMLHGSPGTKDNYVRYLTDSTLNSNFYLIAVDRPGFQGSGAGIAEPSLKKQAACIKPIIEKFQHQKVILVGHSLGGPVIARMAMDYGELLDGLVIVAGSLAPELEPKEWYRPYFKALSFMFADMLVSSNLEIMAHKAELTKMLPLWKNITTPTIVIQGTKDDLVHPNNANFAKGKMINADGLSHLLFLESQ